MPLRVSGMYSGLDTDSIIEELVKAKSTKVENLKKEKTSLEWKQEIWTGLNTKIKSLFNGISNLRFESSYKKKTTSVSNKTAVSVITGENAMNGVQRLSITKLAKTGYLTGAKVKTDDGTLATSSTLISKLRLTKDDEGKETSNLTEIADGGSFSVTVNGKSTDIKVGADSTIESIVYQLRGAGVDANFDETNQRIFVASATSGKDYDFAITANNEEGFTALSVLGINTSLSDPENAKSAARYDELIALNDRFSSLTAGMETEDAIEAIKNLEDDDELKQMLMSNIGEDDDYEGAFKILKDKLEYSTQISSAHAAEDYSNEAVRIAGDDAAIELNGVEYTSNSNNVEVNGITYTCFEKADNITVTTVDDTDGIYDMIKDFIKQYSELINEMDKLYNAKSARDYKPLSDEEKDEMSDSEIEKWEKTIKDSLLRKDSSLQTVSSALKNVMLSGTEVNGKKMVLSDFGIETLSYFLAGDNEKNAYHINGNADDPLVSAEPDKLKTAIANDPDTVIAFFTGLTRNLYTKMDEVSAHTDYQSKGSYFEDVKYKSDLADYTSKIAEAEAKLAAYEDKWYKKFSAMEVALSKLQGSTDSLVSMLGQG